MRRRRLLHETVFKYSSWKFQIHHQSHPRPHSLDLDPFSAHCTHAYPHIIYFWRKRRLNSLALELFAVFIYHSAARNHWAKSIMCPKYFCEDGWETQKTTTKIVPDMNFRQATWERGRESPCDTHTHTQAHSHAFRCLIRIRAWKLIFYLNSR